ncbi:MAG: TonB family protein [Bradymonadia bacterium]
METYISDQSTAAGDEDRRFDELDDTLEDNHAHQILEVMALWGQTVQDVRHFDEADVYTVGQAEGVSHPADADLLPEDPFPLAESRGGQRLIHLPLGVQGEVMVDGDIFTLDDLRSAGRLQSRAHGGHTLRLPPRARCRVRLGEQHFLISSVAAAPKVSAVPWWRRLDRQLGGYLVASAILHFVFHGVVGMIPSEARGLSIEHFERQDRYTEIIVMPEHTPVKDVFNVKLPVEASPPEAGGEGAPGLAGGETGAETPRRTTVRGKHKRRRVTKGPDRRKVAHQTALSALHALDDSGAGLMGPEGILMGEDARDAWGAIDGEQPGESKGLDGMSIHGVHQGADGRKEESMGVGPVSTDGFRKNPRKYRRVSRLGPHRPVEPEVVPLKPTVTGPLEQEEIRKVIRRHREEYKYCYERQLQAQRDLSGKIKVKFAIGANGKVIGAKVLESTMNSPEVERCLVKRIRRWQFPAPGGGATVFVKYPFVFKSM